MKIPYPANIHVTNALRASIKELERTIESCGTLTHKDAKQSDAAKEYFIQQAEDAKATILELHKQISDIQT